MSLEQALAANTAALVALTAVMSGAKVVLPAGTLNADAPAPAPATATKPARAKKTEAVVETKVRFFLNTKHNTTFKREPTEPQVDLPDTVEITEEAFQAAQSAAAAASASGQPSATSLPTVTAGVITAEDDDFFAEPAAKVEPAAVVIDAKAMTEKLMALHKAPGGGNAALLPILTAVGAKGVPSIKAEDYAKVYELAVTKLAELTKAA